jgi:hypothetical protein
MAENSIGCSCLPSVHPADLTSANRLCDCSRQLQSHPRHPIQHGRQANRERRLWRDRGALGQVLGSPDAAIAGQLQDQPAPGPHAAASHHGLRYPQGRCGYCEHEIWPWYVVYERASNKFVPFAQHIRIYRCCNDCIIEKRKTETTRC